MLKLKNIKPGSMIVDMDDILVYTTNLWFKSIMNKYNIFEPYINKAQIPKDYTYEKYFNYPLSRLKYTFSDWLLKKDLSIEDQLIARRFIMEAYLEIDNFYDKVQPTNLAAGLISMFNYKDFNFDKIYIVTRTFDEFTKSKTECIKRLFSPIIKDVSIIFVDPSERKSDAIKNIKNVSIIFDDELSNMYDYLDNCNDNIKNSIMMLPMCGYNMPFDKEYLKKAEEKNIIIRYYNYNE